MVVNFKCLASSYYTIVVNQTNFYFRFRPRLNGATERSHRFLNSALGIFCEHQQEKWEQFLQPAVCSHNVSPISGTTNIIPFFLVFGRDAPSPETISLDLPVKLLPPDHYAKHMLSRM